MIQSNIPESLAPIMAATCPLAFSMHCRATTPIIGDIDSMMMTIEMDKYSTFFMATVRVSPASL